MRPPPPDHELRDGLEWRAEVDEDWRLATPEEAVRRICRHSTRNRCPNVVIAALNRRRRRYSEPMDLDGRDSWWFYCVDHMYWRWIEDGQILMWHVVRVAP